MAERPGTVSQILWHFTGGPTWNEADECQNKTKKSPATAYDALLSILKTGELRLGHYKEVVKVRVPKVRIRNHTTGKYRIKRNVMRTIRSAPICCLADIPVMHLSYHARRYGKFAIGFHREAAIRAGFNPVFYTLHHSEVIQTIRQGFAKIRAIDFQMSRMLLADIETEVEDREIARGIKVYLSALDNEIDEVEESVETAKESVSQFLAFVKTFDLKEFRSVYCEREWRSTAGFPFSVGDVAMIVLPRRESGQAYFEPFVTSKAKKLGLPAGIPVVPWETLLES